jgi:hypothetical protein
MSKLTTRFHLGLSNTLLAVVLKPENVKVTPDICTFVLLHKRRPSLLRTHCHRRPAEQNGYMFTDGTGFESGCEGLLEELDSSTPPATQIRTSSAKDVVQINPNLNDVATGTFDSHYTFTLPESMANVKYGPRDFARTRPLDLRGALHRVHRQARAEHVPRADVSWSGRPGSREVPVRWRLVLQMSPAGGAADAVPESPSLSFLPSLDVNGWSARVPAAEIRGAPARGAAESRSCLKQPFCGRVDVCRPGCDSRCRTQHAPARRSVHGRLLAAWCVS